MTTSALTATNLTLLDRMRRAHPDGSIDTDIVEMLTQRNAFLQDAVFKEGNLPTGHEFTVRTGLPAIVWAKYNQGTASSKSTTSKYTESTGMMRGYSVVDANLAKINGDEAAFRASEDNSFIQAMSNEAETGFFYHSTSSAPEKFNGLATRFSATTAPTGAQILLADGSASGADQTSIWLVGWGDETVFAITPKGQVSGLQSQDFGLRPWTDSNGVYDAYVTRWHWHVGLVVKDARYVVRIGNVDTGNLTASGATGAKLIDSMVKAYHQVYQPNGIRLAWYCNRKVATFLHLQKYYAVQTSTLDFGSGSGIGPSEQMSFMGIPVRQTDAITNTESALS